MHNSITKLRQIAQLSTSMSQDHRDTALLESKAQTSQRQLARPKRDRGTARTPPVLRGWPRTRPFLQFYAIANRDCRRRITCGSGGCSSGPSPSSSRGCACVACVVVRVLHGSCGGFGCHRDRVGLMRGVVSVAVRGCSRVVSCDELEFGIVSAIIARVVSRHSCAAWLYSLEPMIATMPSRSIRRE